MITEAVAPKGGVAPISRRVMNLSHFLRQNARRHGAEPALIWGDRSWNWAEMDRRADAMAAALAASGLGKGDRILVQSRNCNQMFESMFACFRLGAVWVPANFRQSASEVAYLGSSSGASAMICGAEFPGHAAAVMAELPGLQLVVAIGGAEFGVDYDALVAQHLGASVPAADVEYDDPCWFFFTSGTTGRPKAGVLTHGHMAFVVTNHLCDLMPGTTNADASLLLAPLVARRRRPSADVQVAHGVRTIMPAGDRFDAEEAWRLVARWRITNMFTVPTIVKTADRARLPWTGTIIRRCAT